MLRKIRLSLRAVAQLKFNFMAERSGLRQWMFICRVVLGPGLGIIRLVTMEQSSIAKPAHSIARLSFSESNSRIQAGITDPMFLALIIGSGIIQEELPLIHCRKLWQA